MTKEELTDIVYQAQQGAKGCGCCESETDQEETLKEAVAIIWAAFERERERV